MRRILSGPVGPILFIVITGLILLALSIRQYNQGKHSVDDYVECISSAHSSAEMAACD